MKYLVVVIEAVVKDEEPRVRFSTDSSIEAKDKAIELVESKGGEAFIFERTHTYSAQARMRVEPQ